MTYKLSKRSETALVGVKAALVRTVRRAIEITDQDFTVYEGLRTVKRQKLLVAAGASKTMNSRHLTGHAVDLVPYVNGQLRWEWPLCYRVAVAMSQAAKDEGAIIRWGGVWDKLMNEYDDDEDSMKAEVRAYCRRHPGPDFIDGPHFELCRKEYPYVAK